MRATVCDYVWKQAGTGPSRRHIQGSKIAQGLPSVNLQYSKIEKPKKRLSGAPGPANASSWRAKRGGHFWICQHFCRSWRGDPLAKKQIFGKKSQCRKKVKGGTLWDFPTSILWQNSKKIEGGPLGKIFFRKKSLTMPKNWKGGPFCRKTKKLKWGKIFIFGKKSHSAEKTEREDPSGFSNIHSVAKQQKNEGRTLRGKIFSEKSLAVPKKIEGGTLWSRPYGMLRGKTGKTFGSAC